MENPLVSIIVPVYNGEQTIERCLCSIKNQTYSHIEVFMINDGSTDHTEQILRKYEDMDPRFHLINKENSGVSDSRNLGISLANGEYLQFVDGDDWITKEATETFVKASLTYGCDLVISDYYRVIGKKIYIKGDIDRQGLISGKMFAEYMMNAPANFYYGVMWNKFFRKDIVRAHHLNCPEDLNWCEDFQFNLEYLQYVKTVYVCKEPLYYYVKTKGSLVSTQINFRQTVRTRKILFDYYKELYQSIDLYEKNRLKIQMFFVAVAKDKGRKKKTA